MILSAKIRSRRTAVFSIPFLTWVFSCLQFASNVDAGNGATYAYIMAGGHVGTDPAVFGGYAGMVSPVVFFFNLRGMLKHLFVK